MVSKWFALAVLAAGIAVPAAAQEAAEQQVTLEEAVELALRSSPLMVQRLGAVGIAESGERTAWGAFLPSLSMSSGASLSSTQRFNPQTNTTVSGSNDSYSAGVSASVDLFTAGRRGAQLNQARANTATAEATLVEQRFAVALAAKSAFFEVLRAAELIRVAEAQLERANRGLEAAVQRLNVGSATRSDSLRSRLEVNQAEQALLQARSQRESAAYALGATIGVEGPVGARLERPLEPESIQLSEEELVSLAVSSSPAVVAAETGMHAQEAARRVARTQYFPTLRASAGYDWFNESAAINGGRTSWGTRLSLSYPIFNGFAREDANERAEVNLRVSQIEVQDARRRAHANLVRVLNSLRVAEQQLELAEEAVRVAEEDLRVQQERYRLGASTILDQITSQIALAQAESNLVNSRYDYQIARAELEALVGREL